MANELDVLGFPNWDEIGMAQAQQMIGEQTRGGQNNADYNNYLLGAMMNAQANPGYGQAIARSAALQRPVLRHNPPAYAQEWQIGLSVFGTPAQTVTGTITPQCYFRAEKLMAVEFFNNGQLNNPPQQTSVTGAFVGQKNQLPVGAGAGGGLHAAFFATGALGNGIKWSTCQPAISITIQVAFTAIATWYGGLFGKAVL